MNPAKTGGTPILKQREIRQERKARELQNQILPGYAERNLNHSFNPAEQITSLDPPIESPDGATGVDLLEADEPSPEASVVSHQDRENVAAWLNLLQISRGWS